jgi:hypothetical protein
MMTWTQSDGSDSYRAQVSTDSTFAGLTFEQTSLDASAQSTALSPNTRYYFRVRGENSLEVGDFSDAVAFSTEASKTALDQDAGIPTDYLLRQNYPNPFNPETKIVFGLPTRAYVAIKIFDALGREVATLESSTLDSGFHSRMWSAKGLPSGVYFYRMQAGNFSEVKKMILTK